MSLANAGKKDNVPSFEDAGITENKEVKDIEKETPSESKSVEDVVNAILHQPKEKPKIQVSAYLDADVAKAFDRFGKRNGKGSKSQLINNFLKHALNVKNQ